MIAFRSWYGGFAVLPLILTPGVQRAASPPASTLQKSNFNGSKNVFDPGDGSEVFGDDLYEYRSLPDGIRSDFLE